MFYLFYAFIWLIAWLPLGILYLFSDMIYCLVYYLVRYRKKVVRENLVYSFPNKSLKEIKKIERKFYRYFCDTIFETIKKIHISDEELKKRMVYSGLHLIEKYFAEGKSVFLMTAHYGNWEWFGTYALTIPKGSILLQIYRQQKSQKFDSFMYSLRSKIGVVNVEKKHTLRKIIQLKNDGITALIGMLSDQSPGRNGTHHYTNFLNQNTAMLMGTEQLAKKFDYPVFYGKVSRVKRGYYTMDLIPISPVPAQTKEFEITEIYTRMLEKDIENCPYLWLWSHKRWKHTRGKETK